MTAILPVPPAVRESNRQLLNELQEVHGAWFQEIRRVLDSARHPEAGIHLRWRALRYLNFIASPRFEIERGAIESSGPVADPRQATQLWAAAELMVALDWQLDHELGLCHRAGEFSVLTRKFERAMVHWCRAVEDALGRLSWGEIPEQARRRFALLGVKVVRHDV